MTTTTATRNSDLNAVKPCLYMALELGDKKWDLAFTVGLGQKARIRRIEAGNAGLLQREVAQAKRRFKLPESAPVFSCYEAGGEAFWVHRLLEGLGIGNLVVDSSSIPASRRSRRSRRKRRPKTDRLDARKLVMMLVFYHLGDKKVWQVVRVPSEEAEDRRHLQRSLVRARRERNRLGSRLRGLLKTLGVDLGRVKPGRLELGGVERLRDFRGRPLPAGMQGRLRTEVERLELLRGQVRLLEREQKELLKSGRDKRLEQARQLMLLKGIGPNGGLTLANELFSWRQLRNRRQVGAVAGLTPTPYNSGGSKRDQGVGSGGHTVRDVSVELAWGWLRWQPQSEVSLWFQRRYGAAGKRARKIGIVAVARKLLIQLWRFVERGEIPPGAVFKKEA